MENVNYTAKDWVLNAVMAAVGLALMAWIGAGLVNGEAWVIQTRDAFLNAVFGR